MGITWKEYKKGGYDKFNLKKDVIDEVHSRTLHEGKVYRGEAGRNLLEKRLAKQKYYERKGIKLELPKEDKLEEKYDHINTN